MNPEPLDHAVIRDLDSLRVYSSSPLRRQIITQLAVQTRSIHELAQALNVPFTRLYYHIRLLEKHGFIQLVETRPGPGAIVEKFYRITARQFVVDRELMHPESTSAPAALDHMLDITLGNVQNEIRESVRLGLTNLMVVSPHPTALLLRHACFVLSDDDMRRLHEQILALLKHVTEQPAAPTDRRYSLSVALYPAPPDESS